MKGKTTLSPIRMGIIIFYVLCLGLLAVFLWNLFSYDIEGSVFFKILAVAIFLGGFKFFWNAFKAYKKEEPPANST